MHDDSLDRVLGVLWDSRSYRNALNMLLGLPLGILYFTFISVGLSLSAGLVVLFIGIPLLGFVLSGCSGLGRLDARLMGVQAASWQSGLKSKVSWKAVLYLLLRFPLGIASFVVVITGFATSLALLATPFLYESVPITVGVWRVEEMHEATFLAAIGFVLAIGWLHAINALAGVSKRWARLMLPEASK